MHTLMSYRLLVLVFSALNCESEISLKYVGWIIL